jgi:predicted RNA-binding protein YlxR (DUF448 family)
MRSCLGCNRREARDRMLRFVRDERGRLAIDITRRAGGRGGYLHRTEDCWERFAQRKGVVRSLRAIVDRPARMELVEQLKLCVHTEG